MLLQTACARVEVTVFALDNWFPSFLKVITTPPTDEDGIVVVGHSVKNVPGDLVTPLFLWTVLRLSDTPTMLSHYMHYEASPTTH